LIHPLDIQFSDRLRYYDTLAQVDAITAALELNAEQLIENVEANHLLTLSKQQLYEAQKWEADRNVARAQIYGDCAIQTQIPLFQVESDKQEEG